MRLTKPSLILTLVLTALAAVAFTAGCGSDGGDSGEAGKPKKFVVVATTTQLGDIIRSIGGSAVDVHQILQPNTDPHEYEPRPEDLRKTADARLVVTSGDGLDSWIADVVKSSGGDPKVLDAGAGRPVALPGEEGGEDHDEHGDEEHGDEHEHDHGDSKFDPHWWHDPTNVEYAVGRIEDALIEADPSAKDTIEKGAADYMAQLKTLDTGIKECIDQVPLASRKLVTDHDAFGYFAKRYDLDVVGAVIPSQSTQAQPSAGELTRLAALVKREQVPAIFPESSVNSKLAKAIAERTGATADHVLYGDTLGPADSSGATYLTMEQANADAIVKGLTAGEKSCSITGIGE